MKTLTCDKCGKTVEDRTANCIEVMLRENRSDYNNPSPAAGELKHLCKHCYVEIMNILSFKFIECSENE